MSNISRIQGLGPLLRRLRCGRVGRPVCERAGYKTQSSFPSTDFLNFFQCSSENQKQPVKSNDSGLFGPQVGARVQTTVVGGSGGVYAPTFGGASSFWFPLRKSGVFPQVSVAQRTKARKHLFQKAFRSVLKAKSRPEERQLRQSGPYSRAEYRNGRLRSLRELLQSAISPDRR